MFTQLEIMPAVLPPLFAAEGRGKEGMKVTESLVNPLKRVHFHPTPLSPFTTLRRVSKKYLYPYNPSL